VFHNDRLRAVGHCNNAHRPLGRADLVRIIPIWRHILLRIMFLTPVLQCRHIIRVRHLHVAGHWRQRVPLRCDGRIRDRPRRCNYLNLGDIRDPVSAFDNKPWHNDNISHPGKRLSR